MIARMLGSRILQFVLALTITTALAGPGSALAADGYQDTDILLGQVNGKRTAAGIPPYQLDAKMSQGCREHLEYVRLNPGLNEFHEQTPGKPGYTELGHKAAQRSNGGYSFEATESPLYTAPKHRYGDLHPIPERVGLAEYREGTTRRTCLWTSLYLDGDDQPGRRAPAAPRAYTSPPDGAPAWRAWERASELPTVPAFGLGFTNDPGALYVAGEHVFLYHDDTPEGPLYFACRGTLLGPGGRPVDAPLYDHRMLVPRTPLLPGGTYRALATYSPTQGCAARQRTARSTFTTAPRRPDDQLISIGDPYQSDGRFFVATSIAEEVRIGKGTIKADFDNKFGQYTWDLDDWWAGGRPPEDFKDIEAGTFTLRFRNERTEIGPACWSPVEVKRTMTVTRGGPGDAVTNVTAGPITRTPTPGDPCAAGPAPGAPQPGSGAPGTVVRIAGTGLAKTTGVRFGGVSATHWDVVGDAIDVTVPTGAQTGVLDVTTPTGTATASASFGVPGVDAAAPDTWIDLAPRGTDESSTVQIAFSSTEGGGSFLCRLDGESAAPCTSPYVREGLGAGVHTATVQAVDAAGNRDPSPAAIAWRVGPGEAPPQPVVTGDPGGGQPSAQPPAGGGVTTTAKPVRKPTAPRFAVTSAKVKRKTGRLTIGKLTVVGRSRVRVRLAARVGRRSLAIPAFARTVPARGTVTVAVTLPRSSRARLRGVQRLRTTATVTVKSIVTGKTTKISRSVTVKVS